MSRLRIGVFHSTPGWQLLLRQEGVSYETVSPVDSLKDFTVIIASNASDGEVNALRDYLDDGGSLLTTTKVFSLLNNITTNTEYVRYFLPDVHFNSIGFVDIERYCTVLENGNILTTSGGKCSGYTGSLGKGFIVALPFDPADVVGDDAVATHSFYAKRSRLPFERVARISKRGIHWIVARALEILHHQRGMPYVHRWYFPANALSVYNLRLDTDYGTEQEIERLYSSVKAMSIPATWFIDVKSQEDFIDTFAKMEGQEISIHCYEHKEYTDYNDAVENIRKAFDVFQMHGLEAEGFAAPYGTWNANLARAITHCGFVYSSEFSYDYDSLPSFPIVNGDEMSTLQVPVHPVSVGSLRRQGFSEQEMIDYFTHTMAQKLTRREPLFFYHHPKNGHENVLRAVVETVRQKKIPAITLADYARWWKKRDACMPAIEYENGLLTLNVENIPDELWVRISKPDGKEAFTPLKKIIDCERLEWQTPPTPQPLPNDIHRIRSFNPWIPIVRLQDSIYRIFKTR
jgi:peptidoglycan/xylan/chitin deacetylase (PgdA/CDA1 family)